MRSLIQVLAVLAVSALAPGALAESTDAAVEPPDLSGELRAALDAFALEELEGTTAEQRDMMVECTLPVFDGIEHEMLARVLAEADFERGLGVVLTAYPEREAIIEACEELLLRSRAPGVTRRPPALPPRVDDKEPAPLRAQ